MEKLAQNKKGLALVIHDPLDLNHLPSAWYVHIGYNVRYHRMRLHVPLEDLARQVDISAMVLQRFEVEGLPLKLSKLLAIAEALNITTGELFVLADEYQD